MIGDENQGCWSSGSSNDGEIECSETNIGVMNDWMQKSLPVIGSKLLRHISIAGSHDSGMSISVDGTAFGYDCNTETQTQNIQGQLNYGVRYFDIRPIIGSGTYHTGHYGYIGSILDMQGARGESMASIINEINAFTANNNELVILSLSHDYNTDEKDSDGRYKSFTVAQWHALFNQMKSINHLYQLSSYPNLLDSDINTFISGSPCVIVVVDTATSTIDPYKGQGFFPMSSLNPYNKYSDSNDLAKMTADQIKKMKAQTGNYFLLSWTLTQSGTQAATCLLPGVDSIIDLAEEANNALPVKLIPELTSTIYPNIIYQDDIKVGNYTAMSMYINEFVL